MGGDGQPQTMVQLVTGLVDDGLGPGGRRSTAVGGQAEARGATRAVSLESDGGRDRAEGLRALGHEVALIEPRTPPMGWAQVIRRRPDGSYEGGADPRAESVAAGL